jgi:hypothetical protein
MKLRLATAEDLKRLGMLVIPSPITGPPRAPSLRAPANAMRSQFSVVEIPNLPTDPQQLAVRIAFPPGKRRRRASRHASEHAGLMVGQRPTGRRRGCRGCPRAG